MTAAERLWADAEQQLARLGFNSHAVSSDEALDDLGLPPLQAQPDLPASLAMPGPELPEPELPEPELHEPQLFASSQQRMPWLEQGATANKEHDQNADGTTARRRPRSPLADGPVLENPPMELPSVLSFACAGCAVLR